MSGIRGNMETWKAADRWLRGRSTDTDSPKVLILKGPSGVGKTSGSYLLARRCKRNLTEFNTCDAKGEKRIRNDILEGCCRTAFTSDGCNDSKAGLVLIDDLEAFTPTALKVIGDVIVNLEEVIPKESYVSSVRPLPHAGEVSMRAAEIIIGKHGEI